MGVSGKAERMFTSAFGALALRFCSFLAVASAMSETSVTGSAVLGKGDLMSRRRVNSCRKDGNQQGLIYRSYPTQGLLCGVLRS